MSVQGAFPMTSSGPMATDQFRTGACDALGQPVGDNPTGDVGLALINSRR
jgi:hypothetical protein